MNIPFFGSLNIIFIFFFQIEQTLFLKKGAPKPNKRWSIHIIFKTLINLKFLLYYFIYLCHRKKNNIVLKG